MGAYYPHPLGALGAVSVFGAVARTNSNGSAGAGEHEGGTDHLGLHWGQGAMRRKESGERREILNATWLLNLRRSLRLETCFSIGLDLLPSALLCFVFFAAKRWI